MLWEVGEFLQPHRCLCCQKSRAGTDAAARVCRQRTGRRAPAAAVPALALTEPWL